MITLNPKWSIDLLREMVKLYTPSGREKPLAELLINISSELGWNAKLDEAGNFVAHKGNGSKNLLFLGHMDTVEGMIPVREEGNILYARGSVDAKGPLASFISAASQISVSDKWKITCIGAIEEESTSRGAKHIADKYKPDFLIIGEPSGWNRICLGYKGNCKLWITMTQDCSHNASSIPSVGTQICKFVAEIIKIIDLYNSDKKIIDQISFEVESIDTESDGLTQCLSMQIDIRVPFGCNISDLIDQIKTLCPGSLEVIENLSPIRGSRQGKLPGYFIKSIRSEGGEPSFTFKTGTSDMNIVGPIWNCPMIAYGPGDSKLDHTPNEHIVLDEYLHSIQILKKVLESLTTE